MSDKYVDFKRYEVWGADEVERIVLRNAEWISRFITAGVKAVMKDGRPLFTEKIPEKDRLAALLQAPPQFWNAMEAQDPEMAANLAAQILRARAAGKIPPVGPRAEEVTAADLEPSEVMTEIPPTNEPV